MRYSFKLDTPPCKCRIFGADLTKQKAQAVFCDKIMLMKGMTVAFTKQVENGKDALNNPTYTTTLISIDDVLIAPITEPSNARETQAIEQQRDQVRVHLPKLNTQDISNSTFVYDGKTFTVDSDSVKFMDENTPTRWNKYFRAECVNG